MEEKIQLQDARKIIHLLADCALSESLHQQRITTMDRLSALIQADCWVWTTACKFEPGHIPVYAGFLKGGFTEHRFARYLQACEHPDIAFLNEALTSEFAARKCHLTRLREQIDVAGRFPTSAAYPLWCAAGIDKVIMSMRPGDDGSVTAIGFYRPPSQPAFGFARPGLRTSFSPRWTGFFPRRLRPKKVRQLPVSPPGSESS